MAREDYLSKKVRINEQKLEKLKDEAFRKNVSIARMLDLILIERYSKNP